MENKDQIIEDLLNKMSENPQNQLPIKRILENTHGMSTAESYMTLKYLVEEDYLDLFDNGVYLLTTKGFDICYSGGYKKHIEEQRELARLEKEAEIASFKNIIYSRRTRWIAIAAFIISGISLIFSILKFLLH